MPKKIQIFSWLLVSGRVSTCDVVQKCFPKVFLSHSEILNHTFLHCNFASSIRSLVLQELEVSWAMLSKDF